MRIKLVITDACIFIDLYNLELLKHFFKLDLEIHTTLPVFYELNQEQREVLGIYQSVDKLTIHNLNEADLIEISTALYPKSLTQADKSVIHIANKINAGVLSSDKVLRNCARNKNIEYHGMLWIFDNLISAGLLTKYEASTKLKQLVRENFVFRNNNQLITEIDKRLKLWS